MKRRFPIVAAVSAVVLASVAAGPSFAQEGAKPGANEVFAPFVTGFAAAAKDGMVKLSWTDSADAPGSVAVFRSALPFDAGNVSKATLVAEVPYGAGSYIDRPPEGKDWYYFAAATDERSVRYDIVIPYGNSLAYPVRVETVSAAAAGKSGSAAEPAPKAAPPRAAYSGIAAKVEGDSVVVSFAAADPGGAALLYRSASPIRSVQGLLDAVVVQASAASSPFVDYPVPGIGYFYALVPEAELKSGAVAIVLGENATASAVEVPAGRYRVGLPGPAKEIRTMPLPLISASVLRPEGTSEPEPRVVPGDLSPAAATAVAALRAAAPDRRSPDRRPRVFPADLEPPSGGEDYTLRSIVQGPFALKDWDETSRQLSGFLSLPRSASGEARARFYLGQSRFFLGEYREALFEFLLVKTSYPQEANEWIQAVLPRLAALR